MKEQQTRTNTKAPLALERLLCSHPNKEAMYILMILTRLTFFVVFALNIGVAHASHFEFCTFVGSISETLGTEHSDHKKGLL